MLYASDFPTKIFSSFEIGAEGVRVCLPGVDFDEPINGLEIGTIWWRRPYEPKVAEGLSPLGKKFSTAESMMFMRSILHLLSQQAISNINEPARAAKAEIKPLQLLAAAAHGFKIPETLISNDRVKIEGFVGNRSDKVIHKAFTPYGWGEKGETHYTFSQLIGLSDLESTDLSLCPAIYQDFIPRQQEIRVMVIGEELFAVEVHSKGISDSRKDTKRRHLPLQQDLSTQEKARIISLISNLGLSCASLDFIRAPNQDLYFLEINEGGQWIFMENENPSLKILNTFTDHLLKCGAYREKEIPIDYSVSSCEIVDEIVNDKNFLQRYSSPNMYKPKELQA